MAVVLHLRRCQRKYDTNLDIFVQILAEPLFVLPHVAFPSFDCVSRLQDRLGTFRLKQVLHPYALATFVVAVVRGVQSAARFESTVDFGVLHHHQGARQGTAEGCGPRSFVFSPLWL